MPHALKSWSGRLLLALATLALRAADPAPAYRWVYLPQNLLPEANVQAVKALLKRAKAAGYNGAILKDAKLSALDKLEGNTAPYLAHLAEVKRTADDLGLVLVAGLTNPGSANGLLAHAPDLAEGMPVVDVPYRVKGGVAALERDPEVGLANGAFDRGDQDRLEAFAQEAAGAGTFLDREVRRQGKASLRMERFPEFNKPHAMVRATQQVTVKPWRQYRLAVYLRTQDLDRPQAVQVLVKGEDGKELAWASTRAKATQDWTRVETVLPSLGNHRLTLYFGVWGGGKGKVWWTDGSLEEAGLVNLIRREGCPLVVRGEKGQAYVEGRDFEPFSDPGLGSQPWAGSYGSGQASPLLRLTRGSRIREGEALRISGYVVKLLGDGQVAACLGDGTFYDLYGREVAGVAKALGPAGFLMGQDEIRVINQDPPCTSLHLGAGGLLAMNVRRCREIIRKQDPKALICVWSDMFTPTQNAHDGYYLVGGDLTGSWKGIPSDVVVLNWDWVKPGESVAFFAGIGLRQILAGYYDRDPGAIGGWLAGARSTKGVVGVMYTTFEDKYDGLEAFAKAAWGGD